MRYNRWYSSIGKILVFLFFCLFAVAIILPLLWMLISSVKNNTEFLSYPWQLPEKIRWENYVYAVKYGVGRYFLNSVIVTAGTVVITVICSALAAYVLSRFEFKGRNLIFVLIVAGMMISPEVNLVSLFKLMQKIKLYNTHLGLMISYSVFQFPFTVLLFRSYMLSLPKTVEEAAMLDGCSVLQLFTRIVMPMSKPILFSGALFATMHAWNEYMFATVFVESYKLKTVPVGLVSLQTALKTDYPVLIAGLTISAAVVVVVYLIFQKQFIRGLAQGGVKG